MTTTGIPPETKLAPGAPVADATPVPNDEVTVALPADLEPPPPGKTLVPDLSGMDARRAVRVLAERHLEARLDGTGIVGHEHPAAGTIISPGDAVSLTLTPRG